MISANCKSTLISLQIIPHFTTIIPVCSLSLLTAHFTAISLSLLTAKISLSAAKSISACCKSISLLTAKSISACCKSISLLTAKISLSAANQLLFHYYYCTHAANQLSPNCKSISACCTPTLFLQSFFFLEKTANMRVKK